MIIPIGLLNQHVKIDIKMSALQISNNHTAVLSTAEPEAKIVYDVSPYIQYEEHRLNDLWKQYL